MQIWVDWVIDAMKASDYGIKNLKTHIGFY